MHTALPVIAGFACYLVGIALLIYFGHLPSLFVGHCPHLWLLPVLCVTFWALPFSSLFKYLYLLLCDNIPSSDSNIWSYGFIYSVVGFQSNVPVSNWTYLKVFTSLWQADCNNQQKAKWLAVHHPFVPIRQIDTLNCAATTRFFDANWTQQKLKIRRLYFKFFLKNFSIFFT